MKVKITAWIDGEYFNSDVFLDEGKTLIDLLKQISTERKIALFNIVTKEDSGIDPRYMIKVNNCLIQSNRLNIPLCPNDHVVVANRFQFAAGG